MARKAHPVYPYRNFQIDRTSIPPPTAAGLITPIVILSRTFEYLRLKYGLISASAIYLHGTSFALPCLLTQLPCDQRYKTEFPLFVDVCQPDKGLVLNSSNLAFPKGCLGKLTVSKTWTLIGSVVPPASGRHS
ncbi:uncharacterized protein L3040_004914 [Drepanopeziza brunnea f. sp. 'multigermtubi']|uniref:Uncharacterized protein n=1 Tax=Marssonina brunnea f. sp. multigermtubi (strain MB_m1) TaxID=1072389 RepID=K1X9N0_MARBU|nr:uncharacterized protein MBM_00805 [Drepanopeziza brunnea f. sp. 'multigermtubi' MB_m1]EKD21692.1 hypothetical protein MBM_00805 [Drepanopeziza brunnea f. sp. 'multigermtubi' MB_m1]KAJ5042365.1 hypothetical protein L3040_004914 [Drepanopeziza brunnea f. sp. 'multigermtubi']